MKKIAISSAHGKYVRGASGVIDEVNESVRVVNELKSIIPNAIIYHDVASKTQRDNVNGIIGWHKRQQADINISVHFNASANAKTKSGIGTEVCFFKSDKSMADKLSLSISDAGQLINRGSKYRDNLGFLKLPNSYLIEVCFVNSVEDSNNYNKNFKEICQAIKNVIE